MLPTTIFPKARFIDPPNGRPQPAEFYDLPGEVSIQPLASEPVRRLSTRLALPRINETVRGGYAVARRLAANDGWGSNRTSFDR